MTPNLLWCCGPKGLPYRSSAHAPHAGAAARRACVTLWVISVKMALAVERVALHLPSLMELAQGNLSSLVLDARITGTTYRDLRVRVGI